MLEAAIDNINQKQDNKDFDSKINVQRNKAYKIIANSLNELKTNFDFFKKYIMFTLKKKIYRQQGRGKPRPCCLYMKKRFYENLRYYN